MHAANLSGAAVRRCAAAAVVLLPALLFSTGCGTPVIESALRTQQIVVDGQQDDWQGALTYLKKQHLSFGVLNDGDYLYLCMATSDRQMEMQMLSRGFTIWFDGHGGKKKYFGIRYPIGALAGMDEEERPDVRRSRRRSAGAGQDEDDLTARFERALAELDILGEDEFDIERLKVATVAGIQVKIQPSPGMLVYELKIPLATSASRPYAIGASAGQTIGVGLETGEFQRRQMGGGFGGRPGIGYGGGRGGQPRNGGFGGYEGGRPGLTEPLRMWAKIQLAPTS